MSSAEDPSAQRPTHGTNRFPDPFAPAPGPDPAAPHAPSSGTASTPAAAPPPAPAPGDQDLPWKATAERRDLWGPRPQDQHGRSLEGTVHSPASRAVSRPRRSPMVRFGAPVGLGAIAALAALAVVLGTGLGGPLLALAAAAGAGVLTLGGSGVLLNAGGGRQEAAPVLEASVSSGTREVLTAILEADAATRRTVRELRPGASSTPQAGLVLDDVEQLLTRIDALVAAEQVQSLRASDPEVMLLEGIATRYVPELMEAASDTIGFLRTFAGDAREKALANLAGIDSQLTVLEEGVERIEGDLVRGVSRSLEVHSEFLRTRFADQRLDPLIDL